MASVGVKLFVLYLIMGVGVSIAARWVPVIERGGFSPIPFFYVMGGSLVFLFLTWHIPSVAGSMMAGAVSLSLADAVYPAIWGSRAAGAGVIAAGAVGGAAVAAGRWGIDRLRVHTSLHTANGQPPITQSAAAGMSAAPPPDASRSENPVGPEPGRPRGPARAGATRDAGPSKEPSAPPTARQTESTTDESRPS